MCDLNKIPEAERATPIICDWLQNLFHNLDPYAKDQSVIGTFVNSVLEMTNVAFVFGKSAVLEYLPRTKAYKARPKWLLRNSLSYADGRYIVHDLLTSLDGSSEVTVTVGALFIK